MRSAVFIAVRCGSGQSRASLAGDTSAPSYVTTTGSAGSPPPGSLRSRSRRPTPPGSSRGRSRRTSDSKSPLAPVEKRQEKYTGSRTSPTASGPTPGRRRRSPARPDRVSRPAPNVGTRQAIHTCPRSAGADTANVSGKPPDARPAPPPRRRPAGRRLHVGPRPALRQIGQLGDPRRPRAGRAGPCRAAPARRPSRSSTTTRASHGCSLSSAGAAGVNRHGRSGGGELDLDEVQGSASVAPGSGLCRNTCAGSRPTTSPGPRIRIPGPATGSTTSPPVPLARTCTVMVTSVVSCVASPSRAGVAISVARPVRSHGRNRGALSAESAGTVMASPTPGRRRWPPAAPTRTSAPPTNSSPSPARRRCPRAPPTTPDRPVRPGCRRRRP